MKSFSLLTAGLLGAIALQACSAPPDAANSSSNAFQGKLVVTGSSTVAPLASEMAKRFEDQNPQVRIDVQTGGSSRGIADARKGLADIGMVSRALTEEERDLQGFAIAQDGIGIILNQANPVAELTDEQVVQIYTGKLQNWQQVGGEDAPITVVNKADGRSTLELFLKYFQLEPTEVSAQVIIGDNEQGIKTVAGNEEAIGYVSIGAAEVAQTNDVAIKLLPVGGVEASTETVQSGTFPISRPLTLVVQEMPQGLTQRFIEFAQSQEVADLVEQQNFVVVQPR